MRDVLSIVWIVVGVFAAIVLAPRVWRTLAPYHSLLLRARRPLLVLAIGLALAAAIAAVEKQIDARERRASAEAYIKSLRDRPRLPVGP